MDRLPEPLTTFKEFVEADLRRAARLIIKIQDEIDPQFRISTPDGDYWLAVTLPADTGDRKQMLRRVSTFMAWKQAVGFTLASELMVPDCVYCIGMTHREVHACLARITRTPRPWMKKNFGPVEWIDRQQIGPEMLELLPRGSRSIDKRELEMLEKWFGVAGRFPAVHVGSGEVRGV